MFEQLLPYYNRELAFLRHQSGEFAKAHPKIAGNLRISADNVDDPHVARLIEAVALLNARTRFKLEDQFTEISEALLEILYPHFLAPWPSMGLVQMHVQPDLGNPFVVPRGTELDIRAGADETCRFRTTADTTLWPAQVSAAVMQTAPFVAPASPRTDPAVAVLKMVLTATNDEFSFAAARPEKLGFHLRGAPQFSHALYELLLNNVVLVAVSGPDGAGARYLENTQLRAGGMQANEAIFPQSPTAQPAYRLLSEYFACPEKFLFIDIDGLDRAIPPEATHTMEVYFYLNRADGELQRTLRPEALALGVVPIVNLFEQTAEPIVVSQTAHEYRVIPDARRADAMEVYAIGDVHAIDRDGAKRRFKPFYSVDHTDPQTHGYWVASRHRAETETQSREMRISLVDLDFEPDQPADCVLDIRLLCTNSDVPNSIPYGGGHPKVAFVDGGGPVEKVECITPLSPTRRNKWRDGARWRLVSHLALNHISLQSEADSTDALREILRLHDLSESEETRALIEGVHRVRARPGTARFPAGPGAPPWAAAVCRGVDIEVELDPARYSGNGMLMMGNILDVFLGQYCAINSFTRLTVKVRGQTGVLKRWPARAGALPLL